MKGQYYLGYEKWRKDKYTEQIQIISNILAGEAKMPKEQYATLSPTQKS
jgi:hypothetical protein